MVASTGRTLVADRCVEAYRRRLLPHALLVTPNLWEAALLAGVPASGVADLDTMVEVARRIHRLGPSWVLVKGGHLPGVEPGSNGEAPDRVADVLFDGREVIVLDGPLVATRNNHGTGCSLSAAVAAHLARGADVPTAVAAAKAFVHDALLGGGDLEPRTGAWATRPSRVVRRPSRRRAPGRLTAGRKSGRARRPDHFPPQSQDPLPILDQAPLLDDGSRSPVNALAL